ncbi:MAG: ABC transporter permease subunit [Desulfurococcales archaeon]|nr:ABC transporter permease subunit [Desulfurococcales archaeon]
MSSISSLLLIVKKVAAIAGFWVVIIVVWQTLVSYGVLPEYIFGSPLGVYYEFQRYVEIGFIYVDVPITYTEAFAGLILGITLGVTLAIIGAFYTGLVEPIIITFKSIPHILIAAMIITLLGVGVLPKILISMVFSFSIVFFNVYAGMTSISHNLISLFKLYKASRRDMLLKLLLPYAILWLSASLRQAFLLSFSGAFLGEFLAARYGLGYRLQYYITVYNTNGVWVIAVLIMVPTLIFLAILRVIERKVKEIYGLSGAH